MGKKWYVVHTYSGFENQAKKSLEERIKSEELDAFFGEVLIPVENVVEMVKGERRTTKRKFFPSYILVEMVLNDATLHFMNNIPGVSRFVGGGTRPTPISDEEVDRILGRIKRAGVAVFRTPTELVVPDLARLEAMSPIVRRLPAAGCRHRCATRGCVGPGRARSRPGRSVPSVPPERGSGWSTPDRCRARAAAPDPKCSFPQQLSAVLGAACRLSGQTGLESRRATTRSCSRSPRAMSTAGRLAASCARSSAVGSYTPPRPNRTGEPESITQA